MRGLPFFLLTLIACCYGCNENKKPPLVTASSDDYKKGYALLHTQNDSAYYYFNKVVTTSGDSLQIAMAYNGMGTIQLDAGDYYSAQETFLESLSYLKETEAYHHYWISSAYHELGTSSLDLKNYDPAIDYYNRAIEFAPDSGTRIFALNGKALTYQKMGDYDTAIKIFRSILDISKNDKRWYARIVSNLARTRWLQNPNYLGASEFWLAKQIRETINDDWGMNASYSHLSDYYSASRPDSALFYAAKMYEKAEQINSPDDQVEALQKLIRLGAPPSVKKYFTRYQYLDDSIQTARNSAKNQFALIRYEAEKSKLDNLQLQKDNTEKRIQIITQRIFLYGTIGISILLAIFGFLLYRKRKQQMIRQSQNSIRENQLKTSQKVHDVVANGLYRIMAGLEHGDKIEKEQLLDSIEILYEKSRDISYEEVTGSFQDFHEIIAGILASFAGPNIKVLVVGNSGELWDGTSIPVRTEIEKALQELMVNMKKHSHARKVVIRFERQGHHINLYYVDDGVGLPPDFRYGNGLTNTENRINNLGGQISFDKAAAKGLKINVSFPIA